MINTSDQEILNKFKSPKTKEQAFELLVKKYQEKIYFQARRMVFNHEDANDITQNVLIKIWKGLNNFNENAKLYTWIYRIIANETITFINSKKRKQTITTDDVAHQLQAQRAEGYFNGDEAAIKLYQAIETLPEKQKMVFNLKYFEELKYEEIVEILGGSVGSLKASYFHAVNKIKEFLKVTV